METVVHGEFEWDDAKNKANIAKHKIDFIEAERLFEGFILEAPSKNEKNEKRTLTIGRVEDITVVAIYTMRNRRRRIISIRRARNYEKKIYNKAFQTNDE